MGEDPARSVVDSRGRHHQLENLWIADGSIFPTSLGVNPQLSIYAHAHLFATEIAKRGEPTAPLVLDGDADVDVDVEREFGEAERRRSTSPVSANAGVRL